VSKRAAFRLDAALPSSLRTVGSLGFFANHNFYPAPLLHLMFHTSGLCGPADTRLSNELRRGILFVV